MKHRLQKLLAQANLGSRRATEDLITAGRVRVNGEVAILGTKADPDTDVVTLDGERLNLQTPPVYIAYHKPINVLSTTERQPGDDRPTVREMIPVSGHLFSLGRLDAESEGLIIMTNDGELTNELTHPRYEHTKTYQVTVYGTPDGRTLDRWRHGVTLSEEDGTEILTAPCSVEIMRRDGDTATLKVVMTEGRNRQIRRVAALLGHPVKQLVRTHIGRFGLGKLKRGESAEMSEQDLRLLKTPATELEDIHVHKAQAKNNQRRARWMSLSSATPEQIDEARRNKPAPAPRPGKKWAERSERGDGRSDRGGDDRPRRSFSRDGEGQSDRPRRSFDRDSRGGEQRGDRSRRPGGGGAPRRSGPPDGKRPGSKPVFRSRLMLDETGESTPGARRHGQSDTPEGFRSRLGETDRRPRRPRTDSERSGSTFRSRLSEADRPTSRGGNNDRPRRPYNRDGQGERSASGDRPRRPYNRDGQGERSASGDRPRRPYNRDGQGERSASGDRPRRPYNRDGQGERSASGDRPRRPYNRDGQGERSASGDRPRRPYNRDGQGERSASGDRPRRPYNRDGERSSGENRGERSASGDRPRRPANRDGQRGGGDSRPPRREFTRDERGGDRPAGDARGGDRPRRPRPDGDRPSARTGGEQRDNRGGQQSRRPAPRRDGDKRPSGSGERSSRPQRGSGDSRPPRRSTGDRPARPPRKRENDDE